MEADLRATPCSLRREGADQGVTGGTETLTGSCHQGSRSKSSPESPAVHTCVAIADTCVAIADTCVAVADTDAAVADTCVAIADTCVAVADTVVAVADTCVAIADTDVAVADTGAAVADTDVAVSDTGVAVADTGVAVACTAGLSGDDLDREPRRSRDIAVRASPRRLGDMRSALE